jgi:2-polyprenyl-3-methyl-5-hydroxy-6-metoxy-1,4-benzoquinol methylase
MAFLKAHYSKCGHGTALTPASLESVLSGEAIDPNSTIDAKRMIATIRHLMAGRYKLSRRLLDVGSGYGFFSREAVSNHFEVVAIDLGENERQIAGLVSGIEPMPTAFEDLELDLFSISVVLMSQVLEHAWDVKAWVSKAWQLQEDDGILVIALPNFGSLQRIILQEKEPYICPPEHLKFFTPGALTKLLEQNGFVVETIQHVSRVPRNTIRKRVPGIVAPLALPLWYSVTTALRIVDVMRLGSIINVYGRKVVA